MYDLIFNVFDCGIWGRRTFESLRRDAETPTKKKINDDDDDDDDSAAQLLVKKNRLLLFF